MPFTASEDAGMGYPLATFMQDVNTGAVSIVTSNVRGMDVYFNE